MFFEELSQAIIQILGFTIVPLIVWLVLTRRKQLNQSFFSWIGLKKTVVLERWKFVIGIAAALALAVVMTLTAYRIIPAEVELANSRFAGKGIAALPSVLVYSFLQTALSEEILFRGFIGEKLSDWLNFNAGNLIQAILFGLIHGAPLLGALGLWSSFTVFILTGAVGWCMGYVNKKADGSILPSIVIHGLMNTLACALVMVAR